MILRFVLIAVLSVHSFLLRSSVPLWGCITAYSPIHLSMDIVFFQIWAIMNIHIYICGFIFSFFLCKKPRNEIAKYSKHV
jgi:hypothetical protein